MNKRYGDSEKEKPQPEPGSVRRSRLPQLVGGGFLVSGR